MIGRGTTPELMFTFKQISVSTIDVVYLTIRQHCKILFEKDLDDAVVDTENNTLSWRLTQSETLQFNVSGKVELQLRYKTVNQSAFITKIYEDEIYRILKDGEI